MSILDKDSAMEDHWTDNPAIEDFLYNRMKTALDRFNEAHPKETKEQRMEAVRATVTAREWVGLTDEEIMAIGRELGLACKLGGNPNIDFDYARAIEKLLKEKNDL